MDYKRTCRRIHETNYEPTRLVPEAGLRNLLNHAIYVLWPLPQLVRDTSLSLHDLHHVFESTL